LIIWIIDLVANKRIANLNAKKFSLFERISKLSELGIGFPLYFYFKWFVIASFALMVLIAGIPWIVINFLEERGGGWRDGEGDSILLEVSIGNLGRSKQEFEFGNKIDIIVLLNTVWLILLSLGFLLFRILKKAKLELISHQKYSIKNYTVYVSGINKKADKYELQNWLEKTHNIKGIDKIIYWVEITTTLALLKRKRELMDMKSYLDACKNKQAANFANKEGKGKKKKNEESKAVQITEAPPRKVPKLNGCFVI
jgi:hypothetical protein